MKKYFKNLIESKGWKITEYTHHPGIGCHGWSISVKNDEGFRDSWYGEYFVGEKDGKEFMIRLFEEWVKQLYSE